jgi:hypothetical protein
VSEFNVYRWAGRMLIDAATIRRRGRVMGRTPGTTGPDTSESFASRVSGG